MKITMLTVGSTGDVHPYILLGLELRKRGHEITVATFSRFAGTVQDAGLRFFPLSGDAESFMAAIMEPDTSAVTYLPRVWKNLHAVAPSLIRDMVESCSDADAMICNFLGSVYYSVAELQRIPCIQTQFFPMDPTGEVPISSVRNQHLGPVINKASYKAGYYLIGRVEQHLLSAWRKENGLEARRAASAPDYRIGPHRIPVIYAISPSVFPRPAEWPASIHMSGFWFDESPCAWTPPAELEEFLAAGPPPVYIGFGSMNAGDMNRLFTVVLRALHESGLRAVISSGWAGRQFRSNHRVFFTEYLPHNWLFPRVQAVVHHGGAGTTAAGLRFGRPTLVIPFAGDQTFWGTQVHRIHCGPKPIPRKGMTVNRLTRGLIDLTSQQKYKAGAAGIAAQLAQEHGTATAADLIEKEIRAW